MELEQQENKFIEYCKKCNGKCCKGTIIDEIIPIFSTELNHIQNKKPGLHIYKHKAIPGEMLVFDIPKNKPCPFLKETGCILKEKRPINCRMFPLVFTFDGDNIELYFDDSNNCQYTKQIQKLNHWVKQAIKEVKRESINWSSKEKYYFSMLSKNIKKLKKVKS